MCEECYSDKNRITPLLNPLDCLKKHTQYICGTCGRCICIEHDENRGLQRWNFPFKSLEIAKLYLRTADYTMKTWFNDYFFCCPCELRVCFLSLALIRFPLYLYRFINTSFWIWKKRSIVKINRRTPYKHCYKYSLNKSMFSSTK